MPTIVHFPNYQRSDFFDALLPRDAIAALLARIEAWPGRGGSGHEGGVQLDALGGEVNRVAPGATAFVHRRNRFHCAYLSFWGSSDSAERGAACAQWTRDAYAVLHPHASGGAFQNYVDAELVDWPRAYYGPNLARLRAIKRRTTPPTGSPSRKGWSPPSRSVGRHATHRRPPSRPRARHLLLAGRRRPRRPRPGVQRRHAARRARATSSRARSCSRTSTSTMPARPAHSSASGPTSRSGSTSAARAISPTRRGSSRRRSGCTARTSTGCGARSCRSPSARCACCAAASRSTAGTWRTRPATPRTTSPTAIATARWVFPGDTCGVRMPDGDLLLAPTPPPDIDLDAWRASLDAIEAWEPATLAVTHFGDYGDVADASRAAARRARPSGATSRARPIARATPPRCAPRTTPRWARRAPRRSARRCPSRTSGWAWIATGSASPRLAKPAEAPYPACSG